MIFNTIIPIVLLPWILFSSYMASISTSRTHMAVARDLALCCIYIVLGTAYLAVLLTLSSFGAPDPWKSIPMALLFFAMLGGGLSVLVSLVHRLEKNQIKP